MIKKITAVILSALIILTLAVPVYAENTLTFSNWENLTPTERGELLEETLLSPTTSVEYVIDDVCNALGVPENFVRTLLKFAPRQVKYFLEHCGVADFGLGTYVKYPAVGLNGIMSMFEDYVLKNPPPDTDRMVQSYKFDGLPNGMYVVISEVQRYDDKFSSGSIPCDIPIVLYNADGVELAKDYAYCRGNIICADPNKGYSHALLGFRPEPKLVDGVITFYLDLHTALVGGTDFYNEPQPCPTFMNYLHFNDTVVSPDGVPDGAVGFPQYGPFNLDTAPDEYVEQFINYTVNNITNNYGTELDPSIFNKPYDDSSLKSALESIYSGLQSFLQSIYGKIHAVYTAITDGVSSVISAISSGINSIMSKLNAILASLNGSSVDETPLDPEKEKEDIVQILKEWQKIIDLFKKKVSYDNIQQSVDNIQLALFGQRVYSVDKQGTINVDIVSKNVSYPSSMPSLGITFNGYTYSLYTCLSDLYGIETIKNFISAFLWIGFILMLFRSAPSILGNVAGAYGGGVEFTSVDKKGNAKHPID